jgi:hypothetical protein
MNPDRVIPGQVVQADSDNGRPTQPQETFLHKVASGPLGSSSSGFGGRHHRNDEPYGARDSSGVKEAEVTDVTNAEDDTEVIVATSAAVSLDADAAGIVGADRIADADTMAKAEEVEADGDSDPDADADLPETDDVVDGDLTDDDLTDRDVTHDDRTADGTAGADTVADIAADSRDVADTRTDIPAAVQAPVAQRPDGDEPLLGEAAAGIREEWRQVQASFVDDPHASLASAAGVVADAAARLESLLRERQRSLRGSWDGNGQADTENLRQLMLMYRRLLNKLIS